MAAIRSKPNWKWAECGSVPYEFGLDVAEFLNQAREKLFVGDSAADLHDHHPAALFQDPVCFLDKLPVVHSHQRKTKHGHVGRSSFNGEVRDIASLNKWLVLHQIEAANVLDIKCIRLLKLVSLLVP